MSAFSPQASLQPVESFGPGGLDATVSVRNACLSLSPRVSEGFHSPFNGQCYVCPWGTHLKCNCELTAG